MIGKGERLLTAVILALALGACGTVETFERGIDGQDREGQVDIDEADDHAEGHGSSRSTGARARGRVGARRSGAGGRSVARNIMSICQFLQSGRVFDKL